MSGTREFHAYSMTRAVFVAALLLLTAVALALRLPDLGNRPMHGDEAVHADKFHALWMTGTYRYDPDEFHGPTLYYAALPSAWLHGRRAYADLRESDLRLPIALFGAAMVLLPALLSRAIGRRAALVAALLTAVSPALVFYSRYYIQETLLACFTLAAIGCGWMYVHHRRAGWAALTGLCAGLMVATKETAVLAFAAAAVGLAAAAMMKASPPVLETTPEDTGRKDRDAMGRRRASRQHLLLALAVALAAACLLLSGFGTNPAGPLDYLRSYTPWLRRAHGTDLHLHPWHYYLTTLAWTHRRAGPVWTEGIILVLTLVGLLVALSRRGAEAAGAHPRFARFTAVYTLALTALYTAIPYKTPWCVLSFLSGFILLAGIGAAWLLRRAPGRLLRAAVFLLTLAGAAHLAWLAYGTSFLYLTDGRNPWVYAHTVPDITQIQTRVEDLARAHPLGDRMTIKVFSTDPYYYPLPWYLRRFPNVGYWTGTLPEDVDAPVVLASPEYDEELTRRLDPQTHLMTGYVGLRPQVVLMVWVQFGLWEDYLEKRKAVRPPDEGE